MPIFDQGYQHWSGQLSGHAWRWLAIARHGYHTGMKSSILRLMLLFSWLPAIGLALALVLWGLLEQRSPLVMPLMSFLTSFFTPEMLADPKSYRVEAWTLSYSYFLNTEMRFSMVLILIVGPGLISQDIRFNALPLYFSRPLRRADYFFGKLGVIGSFLVMVLVVPAIAAYILGIVFSMDISIVVDTFPLLVASIGYGVVMAFSAGLLMLAISSLSRNSRYVGLFWIGIWFISSITAFVLTEVKKDDRRMEYHQKIYESMQAERQGNPRMTAQDQQRFYEQQRRFFREMQNQEFEDAKTDWRPLVSYTANLSRVGDALLGTDACWQRLSQTKPADERNQYLLKNMAPYHPWQWSAAVLIVLMGMSLWILNLRVKSLDRLR